MNSSQVTDFPIHENEQKRQRKRLAATVATRFTHDQPQKVITKFP